MLMLVLQLEQLNVLHDLQKQLVNNKSTVQLQSFDSIYKKVFLKQFFRIEVLLWKLNFFISSKEALQNLVHGKILINGLKKTGNCFLKKGDIITILSSQDSCFSNKVLLKKKKV